MRAEELRAQVGASGLLAPDVPLLVLFSGGRDSTCMLDVAAAVLGADLVRALHVNYGLRESAGDDEQQCRRTCAQLGITLEVLGAGPAGPEGNLQAWARRLRYEQALIRAEPLGAVIATGHTADDQVETILYRLAASPGRRALLGMVERERGVVRPLLRFTRAQTTAYCRDRGLLWRDDESNDDERFARARVRNAVVPAMRSVHAAAELNVLRTAALLREETELLEQLVDAELDGAAEIALARLEQLPAALARMIVVRLAEQATDGYVPQAGDRVEEILELGRRRAAAELHVGGRAGAVIADGRLRMVHLPPREPPPDAG